MASLIVAGVALAMVIFLLATLVAGIVIMVKRGLADE